MNVGNRFSRSRLEPDFVRAVLRTAAGQGVLSVSITGGEPLLYADEVLDLLAFARRAGIPYTRTGTNGFLFAEGRPLAGAARLAQRLRGAGVYTFWISLDSADQQTHEAIRGLPGVVRGIRRALPILHALGVYPSVNLGLNRRMGLEPIEPLRDPRVFAHQTRKALREFYNTAIDMGFTIANVCYPMGMSNEEPTATYRATSTDDMVQFTGQERALLFETVAEVTREFRSRIRIFSPLYSLDALGSQHRGMPPQESSGCRGGVDYFYLSADDRQLYPCGYRGTEPLGDPTELATWSHRGRPDCVLCDWECFRDPSQLFSPLLDFAQHPRRFVNWTRREAHQARVWWRDLRYYSACEYFSAANPPDLERLAKFSDLGTTNGQRSREPKKMGALARRPRGERRV